MARISYVNGKYLHHADASVHIEDRGYQLADGVYEYYAFYNKTLLDGELHHQRLLRSLGEMQMVAPMSLLALNIVIRELIDQNPHIDGGLYLQVSRGVARRDHPFPKNIRPSLVMTVCGAKTPKPTEFKQGVKVITTEDRRWYRRDVKSISLLANVLAKQEAKTCGAREALLVMDDGTISEGSASNAYIVNAKGELITHPADHHVLPGVTRRVVLDLARANGIKIVERPFSLKELKAAKEAFITSTSINVLPVTTLDDVPLADGKVGEVTKKLMALYNAHIFAQTGKKF